MKKNPNKHENWVTEEMEYISKAKKLVKERKKWEKNQRFEVIQVDAKTVTYRKMNKDEKAKKGMKIHKGEI